MTDADRTAFAKAMLMLSETFHEPVSTGRLDGYFLGLADLPLEAVTHAIRAALVACKFFPRPAELRELAGEGFADVGLIEAMIVKFLWPPGQSCEPFLAMVIQRLGGVRAAGDMPTGVRLSHLKAIVPALVPAALARGIAVPRQSEAPPIAIARPQIGHEEIPRERATAVLRQITGGKL
jgi:hypothetical protein